MIAPYNHNKMIIPYNHNKMIVPYDPNNLLNIIHRQGEVNTNSSKSSNGTPSDAISALSTTISPALKKSRFTPSTSQKHHQIRYLQELPPLLPEFKKRIALFKKEGGISEQAFIKGLETFTEIANWNPDEREQFLGNRYRGLHYEHDLADLWNNDHPNSPIKASQLSSIVLSPDGKRHWDSTTKDEARLLVYRGNRPSEALDELLAGPAVIDCGMFCQLGLWFGIRGMVGDEKFNRIFGKAPFFLTQFCYQEITRSDQPQEGNPLLPFLRIKDEIGNSQIALRYFPNLQFYLIKHLGGAGSGQNALCVRGKYTIFDPTEQQKCRLTAEEVFETLRQSFNAPRSQHVHDEISYAKNNPHKIHSLLGHTLETVCSKSNEIADKTFEKDEFLEQVTGQKLLKAIFDFEKFQAWLEKIEDQTMAPLNYNEYQPLPHSQLRVSAEMKREIPRENREQMSFEKFERSSQLQNQLYNMGRHFCQNALNGQEIWLTLSGNAGIGKTALAVACAKELQSRGNKVCFISESTVSRWMEASSSMEEALNLNNRIRVKLNQSYDVIILDDDNLAGVSGRALLEEVYQWYSEKPGRAVLVTSNVELNFKKCFGTKLDGYHFPPHISYGSDAFLNQHTFSLIGESLRPPHFYGIHSLNSEEKLAALQKKNIGKDERTVGVIVSQEAYQKTLSELIRKENPEIIPSFPLSLQMKISSERYDRGFYSAQDTDVYQSLTPLQKEWCRIYEIHKKIFYRATTDVMGIGVAMRPFSSTNKKCVVIELAEQKHWSGKTIVDQNSFEQLLRVIRHCFDSGGKKVIIVNGTNFSEDKILDKILKQLPESEKERLSARIKDILLGWVAS